MRTLFITSLLLLLSCICSFGHEEYFYYLKGTIGDRPIAMKIEQYDEVWFAKFFYAEQKKDISLKGTCDSTGCHFFNYKWNAAEGKQEILETLSITELSDHTWKGHWIDQNKKDYAVLLQPIKIDIVKHQYGSQPVVKAMDLYSYVRTRDLKFVKVKSEKIQNKYHIDWYKETISGLIFPRLKNGFNKSNRDSANLTLEGFHIKEIENYFSCNAIGRNGEYVLKTEFTFVNDNLIGLLKEVTYKCQSDQTSSEKINLTIALDNGHVLNLEDIFWFSTGTPPPAESQRWYEYRYHVFGDVIKNMLNQLYPDKVNPKQGCNYQSPLAWQFPTWYLTSKGLYVGAFFPGIDRSCDAPTWSVIPFEKIKDYKNRRFTF